MPDRPSELTLTLAGLAAPGFLGCQGQRDASEIAFRLKHFGFDRTAQQVAAYLKSMCEVDLPYFEKTDTGLGWHEYKVTTWGLTYVRNHLPGMAPWISDEALGFSVGRVLAARIAGVEDADALVREARTGIEQASLIAPTPRADSRNGSGEV